MNKCNEHEHIVNEHEHLLSKMNIICIWGLLYELVAQIRVEDILEALLLRNAHEKV